MAGGGETIAMRTRCLTCLNKTFIHAARRAAIAARTDPNSTICGAIDATPPTDEMTCYMHSSVLSTGSADSISYHGNSE